MVADVESAMICSHTTMYVLNDPGETYLVAGDSFEVCLADDGVLVLAFERHDRGGIVFAANDARRLLELIEACSALKDVQK